MCPFKMYRHGASCITGKHKKEGFGNFLVGCAVYFCLIIKAKSWMVGIGMRVIISSTLGFQTVGYGALQKAEARWT